MKTHLGARTEQKTLEGESKRHPNTKELSVSKSPFSNFGVPNGTLKVLDWHFWALAQRPSGDDKAHHFQSFRKRMRPDSHSNHPCLFFRVF